MKTILVLTDFSEAATHAAKYAAILSNQLRASRIILFNRVPRVTNIPETPFVKSAAQEEKEDALTHLKNLAGELRFLKYSHTELIYLAKEGDLDKLAEELINKYLVDYVVMGLTGKSKLEQSLIGSNTIHMARTVSKPLLIVPAVSRLVPITKIAALLDLFDLKQAQTISHLINPLVQDHKMDLCILSHQHLHSPSNGTHGHALSAVKERMNRYQPEYHVINEIDVVQEILDFAHINQVSLIVHIEKKRNLFESLFLTDITERIAYVSHIPVLLAKQA